MNAPTHQTTALVQKALCVAADGYMGPVSKRALAAWRSTRTGTVPDDGPIGRHEAADLIAMPLDVHGDPDYANALTIRGLITTGHYAEPVRGKFTPVGIIIHHTGANTDRQRIPPERMIVGRSGLSGPIVQFGVSRDMSVDCYTSGRAHHAGMGDGRVLEAVKQDKDGPSPYRDDETGNSYFIGIEVDHSGRPGGPMGDHWDVAATLAMHLCEIWGWDPETRVIGHIDWTTRKTDPIFPMVHFRDEIALASTLHHASHARAGCPHCGGSLTIGKA